MVPYIARCRPSRRSWLLVGAGLVSSFVLSALIPAPDASFGTASLFRGAPGSGGDVSAGRLDIWRAVLSEIVERPFFGSGEGSTRWLLGENNTMHVQPHNILLQVFLHWGAIAACAALWLGVRLQYVLFVALRKDNAILPFVMIVMAAAIAALFDGALYYPQMVMLPVAALAFALARASREAVD